MSTEYLNNLVFKHMVELTNCQCLFCSAQEKSTGRLKLFLIFNQQGKVYSRNGIKGTWEEIKNAGENDSIRQRCDHALKEKSIPCYSA